MTRKRYKVKRRACGVCKPGKRGSSNRWSPKGEMLLREYERERNRGWARD